ncbi:NUDIX hydrolase [Desulfosoma caldarium]|uniref:Nudix hydrolase domain-containing protein n=1 Tax=Desulfosoma caldarium TaxID=610254 RepID=A0A3N1VPP9_9BACT|nr:CoA pyrophosphatase [Desulfosoma caldarium]ROR03018.1 hypothetical protein EDC27_0273 [Desulfosoma caldarium]
MKTLADHGDVEEILAHPNLLQDHIIKRLAPSCLKDPCAEAFGKQLKNSSSVLVLLGCGLHEDGCEHEPCLILNRRSRRVRQSGDLCCPGGTVERRLDPLLAKALSLPGFPLARWPHWSAMRRHYPRAARLLALLLATSLRESWEEMRLNPLFVRFLGPLPEERLRLFVRIIHPLVGWIGRPQKFVPNWEVERIVSIPLRQLLNPRHYYRYRLYVDPEVQAVVQPPTQDFACFLYQDGAHVEVLWGATFRIVTLFLAKVFDFSPPDVSTRPIVPGLLNAAYLNGTRI